MSVLSVIIQIEGVLFSWQVSVSTCNACKSTKRAYYTSRSVHKCEVLMQLKALLKCTYLTLCLDCLNELENNPRPYLAKVAIGLL
ncbi:MAG: hypothetical protein CMC55_08700 [Flavobacteriaceae bacterium]|nr:hypothetical protein [Flavobacteriaceae bacterium]|tara:strand:- start:781 stop:1035 length:255 start_codon:yes stop_codon:yes gene_type:complete